MTDQDKIPQTDTEASVAEPASDQAQAKEAHSEQSGAHSHLHGGNWRTSRKLRRREHRDLAHRMNVKMIAVRMAILTTLLFLAASAVAAGLYYEMLKAEERYHESNSAAAEQNSALLSEKEKLEASLADLQQDRSVLQKQLEDLNAELTAVKAERDDLIESNSVIKALQARVAELEAALAAKDAEIAALEQALNREQELDLRPILEKLQAVQALLESGAPMQTVSVKHIDEFGNPYLEETQVYPNLSLSVVDRVSGMCYQWEVGKTYESGELSRLIYALALLECATEEQAANNKSEPGAGLAYDLAARYTLMPEDIEGAASGILQNETAGKIFTYLELTEILLSYNDSIAYRILQRKFGDAPLTAWMTKVETFAGRESLDKLSASDMLVILKRISALIESDSPYAARLAQAMSVAVATYYSQTSTDATSVGRYHSLTATGHHELAIRYDDNQTMMVVFMSDVTAVTPEWSAYLSSLYQAINNLMLAFRG